MLSVDEKSQIQTLDRTQPGLPLKKGRCGTMSGKPLGSTSHDCKTNGTTTLFAALNVLEGSVIGSSAAVRRGHQALGSIQQLAFEEHLDHLAASVFRFYEKVVNPTV